MVNRSNPCLEWLNQQSSLPDPRRAVVSVCQAQPFIQITHYREADGLAKLRERLGMPLPESPRRVGQADQSRLYRLAPECFGIYGISDNAQARIAAIDAAQAAVVDLSHARVRVSLSGTHARDVLSLGISLDLHPEVLPVGEFVQTLLDHNPVLLERVAADTYELMFLRTFALTQLQWLVDAMQAI
jgi:methylglutamate dehydrogenase subunit D